jgi:signal transduction histidine kinase
MTPAAALVAAILLLFAGIALGFYNERFYDEQKAREASVQAAILASTVTAALAFDDRQAAQEYVSALSANPEIIAAGVYDDSGTLFASFVRGDERVPVRPPSLSAPGFESNTLAITTAVSQGSEFLGTVYLRTLTEPFSRRVQRYLAIALLVTMASLVVAVLGGAQAALTRANEELAAQAASLAEANQNLRTQIAEREKAEAALRRAQRMEAVGKLTAGVAHDFNNLLTAVLGNLDMLASRNKSDERMRKMISGAQRAAERGAQLTAQLLAFSRQQRLTPEPVDVNALVRGMEGMLRSTLGAAIAIETRLAAQLPPASADVAQVELMVLNLAINARDAMPRGGTITIATGVERVAAPSRPEEPPEGEYVVLAVSDTGSGIAADVLDRVFEPFFTTKEVGKGSGLGLSQVLGVAQQLGGGVRIETNPGRGTTVKICLTPAGAGEKPARPRPEPPVP